MIDPIQLVPLYKANDERIETDHEPLCRGIHLDNGHSAFVRVLVRHYEDIPKARWVRGRPSAELSVLRWLEANAPDLPVPRIYAFDDENDLLVTTLMPGLDAIHSYPLLSAAARERSVTTVSYISLSPEHSFEIDKQSDLPSFFTRAVSSRRVRSAAVNSTEDQALLSRRLDRLLDSLKPLIAEAQGTPHVDWEFNGSMPAVMSAGYPSWIRSPIIESPLYINPKYRFLTFFNDPAKERNRLADLYEETVKQLDEEYFNCLDKGVRLRDALSGWRTATPTMTASPWSAGPKNTLLAQRLTIAAHSSEMARWRQTKTPEW
ncbi:hypothetical protein B0H10DRAFT_2212257 [Mycena sp. CBHHK59/15]|nr:hypothetical protein B0H10DRAFT_2212257 [Mycena sp. CBHHK59/15]